MNKDLTIVFFIENKFQYNTILKNKIKTLDGESESVLLVYSNSFNHSEKEYLPGIKSKFNSFFESFEEIKQNIKTKWFVYLKPEEILSEVNETNGLTENSYNVQIQTLTDSESLYDHFIGYETRLFSKTGKYQTSKQIAYFKLISYSKLLPEMTKEKNNHFIQLYNSGNREPETVLNVLKNGVIIFPDEIINQYIKSDIPEEKKLEFYIYLNDFFNNLNDELSQEKILLESFIKFPDSPEINFEAGKLYFKKSKFNLAEKYFKNCINMGKTNLFYKLKSFHCGILFHLAYYYLGKTYFSSQKYIEAITSFEECLNLYPNFKPVLPELKNAEDVYKSSDKYVNEMDFLCQNCGNCCKLITEINHHDILRIKNRSNLNLNDFVFVDKNKSGNGFSYFLKKKENSNECIFLNSENKCNIHEYKPLVCRVWPFNLNKHNGKISWINEYRDFINKSCAHILKTGSNDENELKEIISKHYSEFEEFDLLKEKWGKDISNINEFMEWVIKDSNLRPAD